MTQPIGEAEIQVDANTSPALRAIREFSIRARQALRDFGDDAGRSLNDFSNRSEQPLRNLSERFSSDMQDMKAALISLAPAAIPVAAALVPIATAAASAGTAMAAFGAAVIPQISALSDAATAEQKYQDAIAVHGKFSTQAQTAELEYQAALDKMPPATKRASAAFSVLKDSFTEWSDSLASTTLPQFTKSFGIATALLPKFTPLVKGAAGQLDRMTTALAGAVSTPGFDGLVSRFDAFANQSLKKVVDGVIHFSRVLSTGTASGPVSAFFQYAKENGPAVRETLANIADALTNVVKAIGQAGPGVLAIVNAFAQMLASLPTELLTRLVQMYTSIRLLKLAGTGLSSLAGGLLAVRTQIVAAGTASLGASGGLATLRAAFLGLNVAARSTVVVAGVAAIVLVLKQLSTTGQKAAPDIDKLTSSIGTLGRTGKVQGEALRVFGSNLSGLTNSFKDFSDNQFLTFLDNLSSGFGLFSDGSIEAAGKQIDAFDKSLSSLVKNGHADLAASALAKFTEEAAKQGVSADSVNSRLDDYKSALADVAFEQKLTAESMGLFGTQAQQVQTKLDAQKLSADGLRQSIQALNDVNRQGLDGMIGFEAAIDATTKAAKENAGALSVSHGQLDLDSKKAQDAATALNDLAGKTDAAAASARENGSSWSTVNGIYDRGRAKLIASARTMGLTTEQAKKLADQILKTPDKTARLKGNLEDLQAKLDSAKKQLKSVPDSRKAKVQATIDELKQKVREAKAALASLHDKNIKITTTNFSRFVSLGDQPGKGTVLKNAAGGLIGGRGTSTSDSNLTRVSKGEYVVNAAAVDRYGVGFLDQLNSMRLQSQAMVGPVRYTEATAPKTAENKISVNAPSQPRVIVMIGNRVINDHIRVIVDQANDQAAREQIQGVRR